MVFLQYSGTPSIPFSITFSVLTAVPSSVHSSVFAVSNTNNIDEYY